jgi:hypothetical protein
MVTATRATAAMAAGLAVALVFSVQAAAAPPPSWTGTKAPPFCLTSNGWET